MNLIRKHILHLFGQRYDTKKNFIYIAIRTRGKKQKTYKQNMILMRQ